MPQKSMKLLCHRTEQLGNRMMRLEIEKYRGGMELERNLRHFIGDWFRFSIFWLSFRFLFKCEGRNNKHKTFFAVIVNESSLYVNFLVSYQNFMNFSYTFLSLFLLNKNTANRDNNKRKTSFTISFLFSVKFFSFFFLNCLLSLFTRNHNVAL